MSGTTAGMAGMTGRARGWRLATATLLAVAVTACVSTPKTPGGSAASKYPEFPVLEVPAALNATPVQRDGLALGWQRLQAGDLRGANREFGRLLQGSPAFYPAEAGLGFAALADRKYPPAVTHFTAVVARNEKYLPAWQGLADAYLGLEQFDPALTALQRIVELDPSRESERNRMEMLRLRQMQSMIDNARRVRQAGRLDEADSLLTRALAAFPASTTILRELASVELQVGQLDDAEAHAQRVVLLDPKDAAGLGLLGDVLDARGRWRDAAAAYARAAAIDPSWKTKAEASKARAEKEGIPAEIRDVSGATSITRAQLAALIGTRLDRLLADAPKKGPQVATDIRGHWAAEWVVPVMQAGVMEVFANSTFQPSGVVRRVDLARAVSELVALAMRARPAELGAWRAARPAFADLASGNAFYAPAALAVTAGAMASDPSGRFEPTRSATGADVLAALARVQQLAVR